MKSDIYSKAIVEAIVSNPKKVSKILDNARDFLIKNGYKVIISKVSKNILDLLKKEEDKNIVKVFGSKKETLGAAKKVLSPYSELLPTNLKIKINENDNLVGGHIIKTNEYFIDLSYKKELVDLYKKLKNI